MQPLLRLLLSLATLQASAGSRATGLDLLQRGKRLSREIGNRALTSKSLPAYFYRHRGIWSSLWKMSLAVTNSPLSPGSMSLHAQASIDGWLKVKEHTQESGDGKDSVAIYKAGDQCILAFAATDNLLEDCKGTPDMGMHEFNTSWTGCQVDNVHWCLAAESQTLLVNPAWNFDLYPYLTENCRAVHVTGHSLGGSIAGIFASCSNGVRDPSAGVDIAPAMKGRDRIPGANVRFPNVSSLTTFGSAAPTLSQSPLTNHKAEDGIFEGIRFFAESNLQRDRISATHPSQLSLAHPKVAAIRLTESGLIFREREAEFLSMPEASFKPEYHGSAADLLMAIQPVHWAYGRLLDESNWKLIGF